MGAGARALFLERIRFALYAAADDERSERKRFGWRAALHEARQRNLHLYGHRVLPPTPGRCAGGVSPVCEPAERVALPLTYTACIGTLGALAIFCVRVRSLHAFGMSAGTLR